MLSFVVHTMKKSCLSNISSIYDTLSYSEHILADAVLEDPESIVYKSISELSESLGIASSTIVAATKKFGYSGFKDFKLALASETINPIRPTWQEGKAPKACEKDTHLERTIRSNVQGLKEAKETLSQLNFDKAANLFICAKRIYVIGMGTSGILAKEMQDYLFRVGLDCSTCDDHHQQLLIASRMGKEDVVVLLSQSGVNREIIELGEELQKNGCPVIGISNFANTPFSKCTDIILAPFYSPTSFHENNYTLRIPMLMVIETLYYTLSEKLQSQYHLAMKDNQDVIKKTSIYNKN